MRKLIRFSVGHVTALVMGLCLGSIALAQEQEEQHGESVPPELTRTLYVPFEDLHVLLEGQTERVFMTRDEYRALKKQAAAKGTPQEQPPHSFVLLESQFEGRIEQTYAHLNGLIELELLTAGLHEIAIPMQGVRLLSAQLDDKGAPMVRDEAGNVVLLAEGIGKHTLNLTLAVPVQVAAAQQAMQFSLPHASANQLILNVPGNVEVKSGANVIERDYNADTDTTRFQLLPERQGLSIVMSLNNKRLKDDRLVTSRSVLVSEITAGYERLHGTISFDVLHGAVERVELRLPADYQVTDVSTEQLDRWELVADADHGQRLTIDLREPVRDAFVVRLSAIRTPATLDEWQLPHVTPQDVAGSVAVVGVVAETRLIPKQVASQGLIPLPTGVLLESLPTSVMEAEPGAPAIQPISAFYAYGDEFSLTASFEEPKDELSVSTHLLLSVSEKQLDLDGGFEFVPRADKVTAFDFRLPASWQVDRVTNAGGAELDFDRVTEEDQLRIHVRLPASVAADQSETIFFHASHVPESWLDEWDSQALTFPHVEPVGAAETPGAIAIRSLDDLQVRAVESNGLTPLDSSQRAEYGLNNAMDDVAFRFSASDFSLRLDVTRTQPWISSRNYAFFRISESALHVRYELVCDVDRAKVRELQVILPASTPDTVAFAGHDGVTIKETQVDQVDDEHRWTVRLASPRKGRVHLIVEFEMPWDESEERVTLPTIRVEDAALQNQMFAVEGDSELDIELQTTMRSVDIGEFSEAVYFPGARLLGAFDAGDGDASIQFNASRRDLRPLPPAIVQRAEMVSVVGSNGRTQTSARYLLRTKISFVEVELPELAELWAVKLDGKPVKPQQHEQAILLTLQGDQAVELHDLQVVFETPSRPFQLWGRIDAKPPKLMLKSDADEVGREVPQADLVWRLYLPSGYDVSRVHGSVFRDDASDTLSPIRRLAVATDQLGGGYHPGWLSVSSGDLAYDAKTSEKAAPSYKSDSKRDYSSSRGFDGNAAPEPRSADDSGGMTDAPSASEDQLARAMPLSEEAKEAYKESFERLKSLERSSIPQKDEMPMDAAGNPQRPNAGPPTSQPQFGGFNEAAPGGGGGGFGGGKSGNGMPAGPGQAPGSGPQDQTTPEENVGRFWALQGLSSLEIDLVVQGDPITFTSVGAQPVLDATVVNRDRLNLLGWGAALAVIIGGLLIDRLGYSIKSTYVVILLLVCLGLPLVGGIMLELEPVFNRILYAAILLIPLFVLMSTFRAVRSWMAQNNRVEASNGVSRNASRQSTLALLVGLTLLSGAAMAQEPSVGSQSKVNQDDLPPVAVPDDALIVPYDASDPDGRAKAEKVLVSYDEYQRLKLLVNPDQLQEPSSRFSFAIAGADYEIQLSNLSGTDDQRALQVDGTIEIEVFREGDEVLVPLRLNNAIVTRAMLDNKPARLSAIVPTTTLNSDGSSNNDVPQVQLEQPNGVVVMQQRDEQAAAAPIMALAVAGKGKHTLKLGLSIRLERQGGWYDLNAIVPTGPATEMSVTVPEAGTQVRVSDQASQPTFTVEEAGKVLKLAPSPEGRLQFAWRPRIDEGVVDQSLTVESRAILDVREDGLRLAWQLDFAFGRNERNVLRFEVPSDYLVESVQGTNVRGWEVVPGEQRSTVDVQLLKAVRQSESLSVVLTRRNTFSVDTFTRFDAPYLTVEEAALHRGVIVIRRSPVLDVRTVESQQVSRTSTDAFSEDMTQALQHVDSPLGQQVFQAFRFNATPFQIGMEASMKEAAPSVTFQSLLRIGETQTSLETQLTVQVDGTGIQQLSFQIPDDLEIEEVVLNGNYLWSVDESVEPREMRIFLSDVRRGNITIGLVGNLQEHTNTDDVNLPRLKMVGAIRHEGTFVIQSDPSLNVNPSGLQNAEVVLLDQAESWLNADQRRLARLAIACRSADYAGVLRIAPKRARVTCDTFTNVRLTYRAIEESILLDYRIEEAGIRQIQFVLPARMAEAKLQARMVREQTMEPLEDQDAVRVTLNLQDAIMGQYRVVAMLDRPLSSDVQQAPVPQVEGVAVGSQFVSLQNASRDEIRIVEADNYESLTSELSEWKTVSQRLGDADFTMAYVWRDRGNPGPISYQANRRPTIQTSGARIGLAETLMIVDAGGGYRAAQIYHVDNRDEPFLHIQMPDTAELWSVFVAGRPAKPARVPNEDANHIRIPLVKTAEGEMDYEVVLKYGGTLGPLDNWEQIEFPLIDTVNINVQLSQLRLWLPGTHQFLGFEGNAEEVESEEQLQASYLTYQSQQIQRLSTALNSDNLFSVERAKQNLKSMKSKAGNEYGSTSSDSRGSNPRSTGDTVAIDNALAQAEQVQQSRLAEVDNRDQLSSLYEQQQSDLSKNQVNRIGFNFIGGLRDQSSGQVDGQEFDDAWLARNGLLNESLAEQGQQQGEAAGEKLDQSNFRYQANLANRAPAQQSKSQAGQQLFGGLAEQSGRLEGRRDRGRMQSDDSDFDVDGKKLSNNDQAELLNQYSQKLSQDEAKSEPVNRPELILGRESTENLFNTTDDLDRQFSEEEPSFGFESGFSSLDVTISRRGKLHLFTTARGNVELSARVVEKRSVNRAMYFGILVGMLVAFAFVAWMVRVLAKSIVGRLVMASVLMLASAISLLGGFWPLIGVFLGLVAGLTIIHWVIENKRAEQNLASTD